MKAIIITLIIVGGALVATPIVADYLLKAGHQDNVTRLLEKPGNTSVSLALEQLGDLMVFGCWLTGTLISCVGIVLAWRYGAQDSGAGSERRG